MPPAPLDPDERPLILQDLLHAGIDRCPLEQTRGIKVKEFGEYGFKDAVLCFTVGVVGQRPMHQPAGAVTDESPNLCFAACRMPMRC